jgi:putative NADH-flavin reductase
MSSTLFMVHSRSQSWSGHYDEINLDDLDNGSSIDSFDVSHPNNDIVTSYKIIQILFKLINSIISELLICCGGIHSLIVSTSSRL